MKNYHEAAFSRAYSVHSTGYRGLTKIEYFTAMAMQGLCANPELHCRIDHYCDSLPSDGGAAFISIIVGMSVETAKATLDALEKEKQ